MAGPTITVVDTPEAVARGAAERFVALAKEAVAARGRFTVAFSGGSTPRALFQLLAKDPFRAQVPWDRLEIFWGDERSVPPTHQDSNYRMAKEALLDHVPVPGDRVHRIQAERPDVAAAAADYEAELARVLGGTPGGAPPALDLILLGMGPDGHTASLFPGTTALGEQKRWVVANWVQKFNTNRVTLTYPILNRGAQVLFLATGADKTDVLREVLEGPDDRQRLPSQGIRPTAGGLTWLVDRAAAARLKAR
jgi:6-phosphogluconolactonase